MISPVWLAVLYGVSEFGLSAFRRSASPSGDSDRGSLRRIWLVIGISMGLGFAAHFSLPAARLPNPIACYWFGVAIFAVGLALRWYAILYLGRYFTVDVAVAADHRVIDTGPYRYIRHPSYTGVLCCFLGLALALANAVSLVLIVVPIVAIFLYRIRIEEAALAAGLGDAYRRYMERTKRLVPFIY